MSLKEKYPIRKIDSLGRLIQTENNPYDRKTIKYWGDSNKIKIIYSFISGDASVEAYNKKGAKIISYIGGSFEVNIKNFRIDKDGRIYFVVKEEIMDNWRKKLKDN